MGVLRDIGILYYENPVTMFVLTLVAGFIFAIIINLIRG